MEVRWESVYKKMRDIERTRIKICGLRRREDIELINEVLPDYCGFVIEVKKSSRNVSAEEVRMLVKNLDKRVIPVGVFVNARPELPAQLLNEGTLGMAQLHGQEDEDYIKILREMTDKPLIKAFSVKTAGDIRKACQSSADYILLDQGSGGTGKTFDWSLIQNIDRPYFLAGGLGVHNLRQAIETLHPWAVDLSSSLETGGYKDPAKIRELMKTFPNFFPGRM